MIIEFVDKPEVTWQPVAAVLIGVIIAVIVIRRTGL